MNFIRHYLKNFGNNEWVTNEILDESNNFHWECRGDAITQGIWFWSEPFIIENSQKQQVTH